MKRIRLFFTVMVMLLASAAALAQNITVGGIVTDTNDQPVVGATVHRLTLTELSESALQLTDSS